MAAAQAKRSNWRQTWWTKAATVIAIGGSMALAAAGIGFAAVTEFVGEPDAPAQYLPDDTYAYASIDFIQLRDVDRLERFIDAVESAFEEWDSDDFEWEPYDYLNFDDSNVDIEDDLLPWVGRTAAVGVFDAAGDEREYDNEIGAVSALAIVSVRDPEEAEAFVDNYLDDLADSSDADLDTTTVASWQGWEYRDEREEETTVWIVTDDALIVGTSEEAVEAALDANESGRNLKSSEAFSDVVSASPESPTLAAFVSGSFVEEFVDESLRYTDDAVADPIRDEFASLGGFGFTASLRDEGLLVTYSVVGDGADNLIDNIKPPVAASRLPEETILFGAYQIEPGAFDSVAETVQDWDDDAYDDLVDEFDDQFGFDPFADVLPYVAGEAVFAMIDTGRPFSEYSDVEVGVVAAVGVADASELEMPLEQVMDSLEDEGNDIDKDGDLYVITDRWGDYETAIALTEAELVIAVPAEVYDDWPTSSSSLAGTALYQWVESGLEVPLTGFIDFGRLVDSQDLSRSSRRDADAFVDVFPGAGVGYRSGGGAVTVAFYLAVDF